ncbi:DgyrCDS1107 [Dimorphilus gyrociliatus]|uniref:DgyrCDS1107 n=1 Tax=Dimorphilus gyrociliatus TaxID=2664684 RepID=A0A7I8V6B3_9ANNE|nr:DgyrCDS1107 [Dimorphilus gyrociliatus]
MIVIDLEATDLDRPRLIEFCAIAIPVKFIKSADSNWFRVLDKLSFCVYPRRNVSFEASNLTGLYNDILYDKKIFSNDHAELIKLFIANQLPPVCLIAHNGFRFDFKLIKTELFYIGASLPEDLICVDSLMIFNKIYNQSNKESDFKPSAFHGARNIDQSLFDSINQKNESKASGQKQRRSCALNSLYKTLTGEDIQNAHSAESDCIALCRLIHEAPDQFWKVLNEFICSWKDIKSFEFVKISTLPDGVFPSQT